MYNMDTGRILLMFGLIAVAICLVSAAEAVTDKPGTYVDHKNGVETSIPGTNPPLPTQPGTNPQEGAPLPTQPQSVPNYLYNQGGNTVLQNAAGSIYTRPDGRTVLTGANGQTIVTGGNSDSDEDDEDDDDRSGSNVIVNGNRWGGQWGGNWGHQFSYGSNGATLINGGGEGSTQFINNYQINIINGGLQLKIKDKVYNFPPKDATVQSKEKIDIDGKEATVEYDNGNIVIELADGTVFAKTEDGLFSGNRDSYVNRAQIKENVAKEAENLQKHLAEMQKNFEAQMRNLQADLERSLGNIGLY